MKINDFARRKKKGKKISVITCYDYTFAKIIADSNIDVVLVGDSGTMVIHGNKSTVSASVDEIVLMTESVSKGCPDKFIVGDMPFLSYRKGLKDTMDNIHLLMKAGANAVKLEGCKGNEDLIRHIVDSGIPVMGHLGLTPQAINTLGGYYVQGKLKCDAEQILNDAKKLEEMGCFSLVIECVPTELAKIITEEISIPTIGIGAGNYTDGQVLVLQDMLGMFDLKLKFVRHYMDGYNLIRNALNQYSEDVKNKDFPLENESF